MSGTKAETAVAHNTDSRSSSPGNSNSGRKPSIQTTTPTASSGTAGTKSHPPPNDIRSGLPGHTPSSNSVGNAGLKSHVSSRSGSTAPSIDKLPSPKSSSESLRSKVYNHASKGIHGSNTPSGRASPVLSLSSSTAVAQKSRSSSPSHIDGKPSVIPPSSAPDNRQSQKAMILDTHHNSAMDKSTSNTQHDKGNPSNDVHKFSPKPSGTGSVTKSEEETNGVTVQQLQKDISKDHHNLKKLLTAQKTVINALIIAYKDQQKLDDAGSLKKLQEKNKRFLIVSSGDFECKKVQDVRDLQKGIAEYSASAEAEQRLLRKNVVHEYKLVLEAQNIALEDFSMYRDVIIRDGIEGQGQVTWIAQQVRPEKSLNLDIMDKNERHANSKSFHTDALKQDESVSLEFERARNSLKVLQDNANLAGHISGHLITELLRELKSHEASLPGKMHDEMQPLLAARLDIKMNRDIHVSFVKNWGKAWSQFNRMHKDYIAEPKSWLASKSGHLTGLLDAWSNCPDNIYVTPNLRRLFVKHNNLLGGLCRAREYVRRRMPVPDVWRLSQLVKGYENEFDEMHGELRTSYSSSH